MVEPWLRGTLPQIDAVRRQVLHSLEMAVEDAETWCAPLTDAQMVLRPFGMGSVCFHLRHIVRSLDRLLTYAEGRQLSSAQLASLDDEHAFETTAVAVMAEYRAGIAAAASRVRSFDRLEYEEWRGVGRKSLPTTVGGLLVHCAEHTQRHLGQAISAAQLAKATIPPSSR
jgi:uncharacterized damage-inducible protein DinB